MTREEQQPEFETEGLRKAVVIGARVPAVCNREQEVVVDTDTPCSWARWITGCSWIDRRSSIHLHAVLRYGH